MGKKKAQQAQGGKKQEKESNDAFEQMLAQLAQTTGQNENLKGGGKVMSKAEHKKERQMKLKALQQEKQAAAEAEEQQRAQMMEFLNMLRKQQMQSDFLEAAKTDKEIVTEEDDDVRISSVAMQGWRLSMEDAHLIEKSVDNGSENVQIYGVFDGHSGSQVAEYTAANLLAKIKEQDGWAAKDYEQALRNGFLALDKEMKDKEMPSGSTATVCLIAGGKVYTANSGDSRAVMCRKGELVALSEDHKPTNAVETARITKAGHTVQDVGGIGRVDGMLAVSRGFGDFNFKKEDLPAEEQPVTVDPDISVEDCTETEYIIIACDGIWDTVSNEEIIRGTKTPVLAATSPKDLSDITSKLFDEILSPQGGMLGSDNMSMIIVQFKKNCVK